MKAIACAVGILLFVLAVCVGVYFGIWWAFIGGIIAVIEAVRAETLVASDVALGIARIVFAGLIGMAAFFVAAVPGMGLLAYGTSESKRRYR